MSWDVKLTLILLSIGAIALFGAVAHFVIRRVVHHCFARSFHDFYVEVTHQQPECGTCPYRSRCPYAGGPSCHFSGVKESFSQFARLRDLR